MRPWHFIRLVLAAALVAALFTPLVLAVSLSPDSSPCDEPDHKRRHGLLSAAQKQYAVILNDDPATTCASDGMELAIHELCKRGRYLAERQAHEQARKVYADAIAIEPSGWKAQCAINGLADLPDGREIQEPERQEPERQEPERQEPERQEPELQEGECENRSARTRTPKGVSRRVGTPAILGRSGRTCECSPAEAPPLDHARQFGIGAVDL